MFTGYESGLYVKCEAHILEKTTWHHEKCNSCGTERLY